MKMLSFFGALLLSLYALTAIEHDESRPHAKQFHTQKITPLSSDLNSHEKGKMAEKKVASFFTELGYFECPTKYSTFGNPNAVNLVSPHEENGLDGLFVKFKEDGRGKNGYIIDHIIVNESKFQTNGGLPKLEKMGCFSCSGGPSKDEYSQTNQMSWRWIHNAVEWAAKKGSSVCNSQKLRSACEEVCPLILAYLEKDLYSVIRTASVLDAKGNLSLYTLYDAPQKKETRESIPRKTLKKTLKK